VGAPYGVMDGKDMKMIGFFVMMFSALLVEANPLATIIGLAIALALIILGDIYFPETDEDDNDDVQI
jgi:hypothetical protein